MKKKREKKNKKKKGKLLPQHQSCGLAPFAKNLGTAPEAAKYRKGQRFLGLNWDIKAKEEASRKRGDFFWKEESYGRELQKNKQGEGTKRLAAGCFWAARKKGKESWVE